MKKTLTALALALCTAVSASSAAFAESEPPAETDGAPVDATLNAAAAIPASGSETDVLGTNPDAQNEGGSGEASAEAADAEEEMTLLDLYIHGRRVYLPEYPLIVNDTLMLPIKMYLENVTQIGYCFDGQAHVDITRDDRMVGMDIGSSTAFLDGAPTELSAAPMLVGDTIYAPMRFITEYFGFIVHASKTGNHLIVRVSEPAPPASAPSTKEEEYVNSAGLSSDTAYLIWVNKETYTVNVFLGSKNNWSLLRTFPCAIGASSTPTITGTFKFFSLESRWTYSNFYVGPIMRFRGGYAIHSTLLKYDGTDYNATVGKKISHGCIRVRPNDMNWLVSYVPLQTTIHITER